VIKGGGGEGRGVVAQGAGCRESGSHVRGVRCAGEVGLMAGVAIGRQGCVVVVDVAGSTGNGCVGAGQWERRVVVIEDGACPRGRGVACRACSWETCRSVIGIGGPVVIRLVA